MPVLCIVCPASNRWRANFSKAYSEAARVGVAPTEIESKVANAFVDLEVTSKELKADLRDLYITAGGCAVLLWL